MALETDRSSPSNASSPGPNPSPATSTTSAESSNSSVVRNPMSIEADSLQKDGSSCSFSPQSPQPVSPEIHVTPSPSPPNQSHHANNQNEPVYHYNFPPQSNGPRENQVQGNPGRITLNFSVDNILRPEFGRRAVEEKQKHQHQHRHRRSIYHHHHSSQRHQHQSRSQLATTPEFSPKILQSDSPRFEPRGKSPTESTEKVETPASKGPLVWPAWVYCTRYSDRPSSGPRSRRMKKKEKKPDEKRPRTAFTQEQLARLKKEFEENRYLTEKRRQDLARDLALHENQIKIWFQNKRAKIKKATGQKGGLALQLMAQGLYNHSTVPVDEEEMENH